MRLRYSPFIYESNENNRQIDIVNDQAPDKVIIKSRQLGLSEIGVAEMLWFADRYSEFNVKCLYTFPGLIQLWDFSM